MLVLFQELLWPLTEKLLDLTLSDEIRVFCKVRWLGVTEQIDLIGWVSSSQGKVTFIILKAD